MLLYGGQGFVAGSENFYFGLSFIGLLWIAWQVFFLIKKERIRKKATREIYAVITERKVINLNLYDNAVRYVYSFSGLEDYKGVTFHDKSIKVKNEYLIGEEVVLHVNPQNAEQFYFEEEDMISLTSILCIFISAILCIIIAFGCLSQYK